jgi:hypothetical protein
LTLYARVLPVTGSARCRPAIMTRERERFIPWNAHSTFTELACDLRHLLAASSSSSSMGFAQTPLNDSGWRSSPA